MDFIDFQQLEPFVKIQSAATEVSNIGNIKSAYFRRVKMWTKIGNLGNRARHWAARHYWQLHQHCRNLRLHSPAHGRAVALLRARVAALPPLVWPVEAEWEAHQLEVARLVATHDPRRFLMWPPLRRTMFHTPPVSELRALQAHPSWPFWKPLLPEDACGHPERYEHWPLTSGNLVHHAFALNILLQHTGLQLSQLSHVWEWGGGYGSFCRLCYKAGFRGAYTITDLPVFSALQAYFLSALGLNLEIAWQRYALAPRTVSVCSHELAPPAQPEVAVALWSLSECPLALRWQVLQAAGSPRVWFFGYQNQYRGYDNAKFFETLRQQWPHYQWLQIPVAHLPENFYLLAQKFS